MASSSSPTTEGFRLIFRRPSIPVAELAWRWSFGAAAWFLGAMFLLEYADTLPVRTLDRLLLRTQQPLLVWQAIHRIFEGSAFRFTKAGILLTLALAIAWIVLASLGRAVVLRSVMHEFDLSPAAGWSRSVRSLVALNFLRAAVTLAAELGKIGSVLLASSFWASTHVPVGDALRLLCALVLLTAVSWIVLNWILSVAAIFVVDEGQSAFGAIAATGRLCVERMGPVLIAGTWFGLAHFGLFIFACGAGLTVLGMAGVIGAGGVLLLGSLIALLYFAVVDWLYVGRLAAYLHIIRAPEASAIATPELPSSPDDGRSAVDPGELILSDVPLPAS